MFKEENALPRAEPQSAVRDRDDFARAGQDGANMRSAVVSAFRGMLEIGGVLGHEAFEKHLEITPGGWVGVFRNDQATTCVPNEDRDGAGSYPALVTAAATRSVIS